jgi:S-adenosylmethionine:tRNA ribosyltransferase-isomerase
MNVTMTDSQPVVWQAARCEGACAQESEVFASDFTLPSELEAWAPAEARGMRRDDVRLLVSYRSTDRVVHTHFRDLAEYLNPGDVLVINTSGTMNAAIEATRPDGTELEVHLSTHLPGDMWTVELREPDGATTRQFRDGVAGEALSLNGGGQALVHALYSCGCDGRSVPDTKRLWLATLYLGQPVVDYFAQHGFPIRYGYVKEHWPTEFYQTAYVTEVGSAEMPSAGRAFTPELIARLVAGGVQFAPLLLHTGVASLEDHEPPYEEFYRVPPTTARAINAARQSGNRIVAVGTTAIRALETVTTDGVTYPGEGWTCHVVGPQSPIKSASALVTGFHEPRSSHLMLLEGLAPRRHLALTYAEALKNRNFWHEFGDLHLLLE